MRYVPTPGACSGRSRPTGLCVPPLFRFPMEAGTHCYSAIRRAGFIRSRLETGALLWKKKIEEHDAARLTGTPVAYNGNVFVPVASWEETRSLDPTYPCCTFRGSIVALRIRDGQQVWKSYLVPEPKRTGQTKLGTPQYGPSGAGVWASPTLDARRGVMYIATGDNYSSPATPLSDAIVALEITTGRVVWSKQTSPGDAYNSSCGTDKQNCPEENGPDYDFGSSAILTQLPDGRDILLAGQKSGMVYALDPAKEGRDCLAGAHRESRSQCGHQRRRAVGHGERWPAGLCGHGIVRQDSSQPTRSIPAGTFWTPSRAAALPLCASRTAARLGTPRRSSAPRARPRDAVRLNPRP